MNGNELVYMCQSKCEVWDWGIEITWVVYSWCSTSHSESERERERERERGGGREGEGVYVR